VTGGAFTVCAVTVTYGERAHLVRRAVRAALAAGADAVVVVANGIGPDAAHALGSFAAADGRIEIVDLHENRGSAAGFAAGLRRARELPVTHVWLLDDDNEPERHALDALRREASARNGSSLLLSLRADRPQLDALAAGLLPEQAFPPRSSFLNFDVRRRLRSAVSRARRTAQHAGGPVGGLPYAPFGGLLLPKHAIDETTLPDEQLVVYEDDTDFTHRLVRSGWEIVLVPTSEIRDCDTAWYEAARGRGPGRLLHAASDARVYYSVRNRVYFESRAWRASRRAYTLNKAVFLAILLAEAVRTRRLQRFRLVLRGVRDGECGRLGRTLDLAAVR
jgi:GT2 family glycosyltransferase